MLDAFVFEPFSINQSLLDSFLLENDGFEVWIAHAAPSALSGSGSISDPYLVSNAIDLDNLLASFGPGTTIHLAPGTYTTQGHSNGLTTGWTPRRGQRIVGAGVDLTVLQLVVASPTANAAYFVIGADDTTVINELEISDLTLDANQRLAAHSSIAAGGVKVYGTHLLLNRVRVINAGTLTTSKRGNAIAVAGAFPDNPEPFDAVVEECIIDQVYLSNVREMACISLASGERAADGFPAFHKGCVVRNCLIDCKYVSNEVAISSIHITDTTGKIATVTTKTPHGLSGTPWIVISGALEASQPSTHFNGAFQVDTNPIGPTGLTFTIKYYDTTSPTTAVDPTGDMSLGRAPSQRIALQPVSFDTPSGLLTVTTKTPHYLVPGQKVVFTNVAGSGAGNLNNPTNPLSVYDLGGSSAPYNPLQFRIQMSNPGSVDVSNAWIGVDFYGIAAGGGRGVIVEGNRILNTTFGLFRAYDNSASGTYRDSLSSKDMVVRDNYF